MNSNDILRSFYAEMAECGIDVYVFTNKDPGFSEEPVAHWQVLDFIFGYGGDNAALVMVKDRSYFFTDSRFEADMRQRLLGTSAELVVSVGRSDDAAFSFVFDYLKRKKGTLGFDFKTVNVKHLLAFNALSVALSASAGGLQPKVVDKDLADKVWLDRPVLERGRISDVEDLVFPGTFDKIYVSRKSKLGVLGSALNRGDDRFALLFTDAADIAWLLNIRCFDNKPSMIAPAFFIIYKDNGYLFVQGEVGNKLKYKFGDLDTEKGDIKKVTVFDYGDFFTKAHFLLPRGTGIIETSDNICALMTSVLPPVDYPHLPFAREKFDFLKSIHPKEEVDSISLAFREDAKSFISLLLKNEEEAFYDEMSVVKSFASIRQMNKYYISDSFPVICGFGPNGALPHYAVSPASSREIDRGLLVLDFGGQYDFGTTDTTRTLVFGSPTDRERMYYTAILKAHIYLQRISVPFGIQGIKLDSIIRGILFEYGIEVPHGIGHGVSMLGPVHDGVPALTGAMKYSSGLSILPGMVFTIEPGVYLNGEFGIRIENTVVALNDAQHPKSMVFRPLTLCPYERRLIDVSMLNERDVNFINGYHRDVYNTLKDELGEDERRLLCRLCQPLGV